MDSCALCCECSLILFPVFSILFPVFANRTVQGGRPRILNSFVKGFKREKLNLDVDLSCTSESCSSHLEDVFMRNPFLDPPSTSKDYQEAVELNIGFLSL